jgi:hypothetical protein
MKHGLVTFAGRRDGEHIAQDRHRIVGAPIFDEVKSHFGPPAKIMKCRLHTQPLVLSLQARSPPRDARR